MSAGFVYVLANDCMPGVLKVGKTCRLPTERSLELFTTGVPVPFRIVFSVYSHDMDSLESRAHRELAGCRVNDSREFFRISEFECVKKIMNLMFGYYGYVVADDMCVIKFDDVKAYSEKFDGCMTQVVDVISKFTGEEWKLAASRLDHKPWVSVGDF